MEIRKLFWMSCSIMLVVGCSHKKDSSPSAQAPRTKSEVLTDGYRFKSGDCDTQAHLFIGQTAEDLKNQFCAALQDSALNHGCAEDSRLDTFNKKCIGMSWAPTPTAEPNKIAQSPPGTQTSTPTPTSTPTSTPTIKANPIPGPKDANPPLQTQTPDVKPPQQDVARKTDVIFEEKIRLLLSQSLVNSMVLPRGLSSAETAEAQRLAQAMQSCGFSYMGPKCLEYAASESENFVGFTKDSNLPLRFVSEVRFQETDLITLLFVYDISGTASDIESSQLKVYRMTGGLQNIGDIDLFLKTSSNYAAWLDVSFSPFYGSSVRSQLKQATDIKQLYHLTRYLLDQHMDAQSLAEIVSSRISVVKASDPIDYQTLFIDMVLDEVKISDSAMDDLTRALLTSKDEYVQQIAAVYQWNSAKSKNNMGDLQRNVVAALENKRASIRSMALDILSQQKDLGKNYNNVVIGRMNDADQNVRAKALLAVRKMPLGDDNLEALDLLKYSPIFATRFMLPGFIANSNISDKSDELIRLMSVDTVYSVREEVAKQLSKVKLSGSDAALLGMQLKSPYSDVVKVAAGLLGQMQGPEANKALIENMSTGGNFVSTQVFALLTKRTLGETEVPLLAQQMHCGSFEVCLNVLILLQKIPTSSATNVIVAALANEFSYTRVNAWQIVQTRTLDKTNVSAVAELFRNKDNEIHLKAVQLLSKIKGPEATSALKQQLGREDNAATTSALTVALSSRKN